MKINAKFNLLDKVVVLTGASGFLGSQFADGLSQFGAHVVLADLDYEKCKKLEDKLIKSYGTDPLAIRLDITKKNSLEKTVKKVLKKYDKIDILINNAAYQSNSKIRSIKFENFPLVEWDKGISVNMTGVFLCCQEIGKIMKKQGHGNIINIASVYGIIAPDQRIYGNSGLNSPPYYSATKSAVIGLTRYLAAYWGEANIRVNCISPGGVENKQDRSFLKKYSDKTMVGRMARSDEIVSSLIFLASDASSYITGSNLVVDGGISTW